jgi:hypothetical protein
MELTNPLLPQRPMVHVLQRLMGVRIYIEDITLYSKAWDEFLCTLKQVFTACRMQIRRKNLPRVTALRQGTTS